MYTVEKNAFAVINNTPTYGLKIPLPTPNSSTVWVIGLLCQTSQNCCFGKFSFVLANSYLASNLGEEVDCAQYALSRIVAIEVPKAPVIILCLGGILLKPALKTTVLAAVNPQNVFQQSLTSLILATES